MPKCCLWKSKTDFPSGLVKISTSWSLEPQNWSAMSPLLTNSRMKWNRVSMCLLFLWNTWFLDNAIADVLSQKIGVGSFSVCDMSFNNLLSHTAWQEAEVAATYSASAEDIDTIGCFFDAHEIRFVPSWKTYPDVLFLSSRLVACKVTICVTRELITIRFSVP